MKQTDCKMINRKKQLLKGLLHHYLVHYYQSTDQFNLLYNRVVAMDMRGYGESDKPSGVENYVMEKLDNDLKVGHLYEL